VGKRLHKTDKLTIRFTPDQSRSIDRAAKLESERRGELVEQSTLVREIALLGVEQILAKHEAAA
jgi:uncharacterized protein (DUF1778 family)